jgi:type VI secretion system protein ImpI
MTIILKIDNMDALPDGGPLSYQAQGRGFEIGREHRDWTLPDPNMFISGRHCEVRYEKGGYWLYDFSRNGTFVNGSRQRIKNPHRLADGDRIQIGHYFVTTSIDDVEDAPIGGDAFAPPPPPSGSADDIWDTGAPSPPPISRRELMPPQRKGQRSADFAEQFLEMPPIRPVPGLDSNRAPAQRSPGADPFTDNQGAQGSPFGGDAPPQSPFSADAGLPRPPVNPPFPLQGEGFAPPTPPNPVRPLPAARPFEAPVSSSPASAGGTDAILRAIATGAGVSPEIFLQRPAGDVAAEIGLVLRTVVEELALLLKARAAAKVLAKSGNRTMISAVDNNPLKFVPRAEEVLEIMFAKQRAGYLDAKHSIDEAFRDLKTHEFATYAAMQKALSRLLEDLSPEAIEKKVSSSTFSSKKARSWEIFQATWEAKEKPHENGMLDVFLAYFSDAYAKASKPR